MASLNRKAFPGTVLDVLLWSGMIARTLHVAALLIVPAMAEAHETWANGDPVPAWVREVCCSAAHAHHLADSAVHEMPDGYHVDGYPYVIPYQNALPSPDGSMWLFYETHSDGSVTHPFCFFYGTKGS